MANLHEHDCYEKYGNEEAEIFTSLVDHEITADEELDNILTDGIIQASNYEGLRNARLATTMSEAVVFSGTVLPLVSGTLTEEEREEILRALND